jgi:hypothetical protein
MAQVALLDRRLSQRKAGPAQSQAAKLHSELTAMRGVLIDVNYSQAQLWASGLHEKLNALFDTVDSGDFAPARQTREVFDVLAGRVDELLQRWQRLNAKLLPSLNASVATAGLETIG